MRKDKVIRLRCTEEEFSVWTSVAKDCKMTVSDLVRYLLSNQSGSRPVLAVGPSGVQSFAAVPVPKSENLPGIKPEVVMVRQSQKAPVIPEGHPFKCTCLKCQKAKGWRG